MKIQLKLVSLLAVIAIACGGLCPSGSIRAQSAPTTPDPDANKKEAPANAATSPTPTPTPKR